MRALFNSHLNIYNLPSKNIFKLLALLLFLFCSFALSAQVLDDSFLESLPENVRKDIEQKSVLDGDKKIEYINPDTRVANMEESLRIAEQNLAKLKAEFNSMDTKSQFALPRFGDRFFNSFQASFLPVNEPSASGDYILDYGDVLTVQIVGGQNSTSELLVKRDGTINLPDIENIVVGGLSLDNAINIIAHKVSQAYAGAKSYTTLSAFRDMNVLVVGNVKNPGMYVLSGGSSPLGLLSVAGGIDPKGSYRNISHKRDNELLQNIDLYDVFLQGNMNLKNSLRSGDALVVHPRLNEIRVSGGVANPAIYEVKESEDLLSLLQMASLNVNHINKSLTIERLENGKYKKMSVELSDASQVSLVDGDSVELLAIEPSFNKVKKVKVSGQVLIPGTYTIPDDARLSDVIKLAGGYTSRAYPLGGVHTRESVKALEKESMDKGYNELIRYLVSSPAFGVGGGGTGSSEGTIAFLSLLKQFEPSGRIISEFDINLNNSDGSQNRILQDGDSLHVPAFMNEVFVFGEVMSPGGVPFDEMKSGSKYIQSAGGFSRVADVKKVVLISPNGAVDILERANLFKILNTHQSLLPGSIIYVPRQIGKVDGINLASSVAPIISSVALSIASLNSINN
jgi:protein involved in polysaccharide export with SLBB domain